MQLSIRDTRDATGRPRSASAMLQRQLGHDKPRVQGVTANTRAIGVMMPNHASIKGKGWRSFRVSVKQVERET
ncbi:MAG: hypothetical protein ICV61_03905, partial [Microcoleus sp. Co-bin12]|nr:hypothetical protein [Microcoleus sp. Co-bin12]